MSLLENVRPVLALRWIVVLSIVGLSVPLAVAQPIGHVVATEGDGCLVLPGGAEQAALTPRPNHPLELGDALVTGPDCRIQVLLDRDGTLALGPDSRLSLDESVVSTGEERVSRVKLLWGRVRAAIRSTRGQQRQFDVATETAVVGVKGTEFVVDAGPPPEGDTRSGHAASPVQVIVVQGAVEFAGRTLTTGMGVVLFPDGLVQVLDDIQVRALIQRTHVVPRRVTGRSAGTDRVFRQAEVRFKKQRPGPGRRPAGRQRTLRSDTIKQPVDTEFECPKFTMPPPMDWLERMDAIWARHDPSLSKVERRTLILHLADFCEDEGTRTVFDRAFHEHLHLDEEHQPTRAP